MEGFKDYLLGVAVGMASMSLTFAITKTLSNNNVSPDYLKDEEVSIVVKDTDKDGYKETYLDVKQDDGKVRIPLTDDNLEKMVGCLEE